MLVFIFLLVLAIRFYFTLSTPNFTGDQAYNTLNQVKHISETGIPLFYDDLSYGGRFTSFHPLFYYILAFFNLFLPLTLVGKLIPNILASTLVILIYVISLEMTQRKNISLINAFIAGFVPLFFKQTINSISVYSLAIPLIFLSLFALMNINKSKQYIHLFLISLILLMFTHASSFLLILSLLIYLILIKAINLPQSKLELELILFSAFIVIWFLLVLFKNAFLLHGYYTIWQNVPEKILSHYFFDIGILEAIYAIGIIPFVFGIYIIYKYIFKKRKRAIYIFTGTTVASFFLIWFKLLKPSESLILLGISLVVLSSQYYKDFSVFISKTKIPHKKIYLSILIAILILTSFLPSLSYAKKEIADALTDQELSALNWLKENTPESSTIVSSYKEGHLITSIAKRKNFLDQNFLLIKDINQRFEAHEIIYNSKFSTNAIRLLTKYNIDYIYFSPKSKSIFDIKEIAYTNKECFPLVYDKEIKIYKVNCVI